MPRIVDDEPPIKTHPASAEYRENWDRIFGAEEKSPQAENEADDSPIDVPEHDDNCGARCRYAGERHTREWLAGHDCCGICNDLGETP
jgi:hypothetical protein